MFRRTRQSMHVELPPSFPHNQPAHQTDEQNANAACSCWRDSNNYQYCDSSPWNDWVRWLVLVIIVVAAFLLFVVSGFLQLVARRRHAPSSQQKQ